jgi:ssDNA-specific exonuclease RecJ
MSRVITGTVNKENGWPQVLLMFIMKIIINLLFYIIENEVLLINHSIFRNDISNSFNVVVYLFWILTICYTTKSYAQ